jgi:hypothetical protein
MLDDGELEVSARVFIRLLRPQTHRMVILKNEVVLT